MSHPRLLSGLLCVLGLLAGCPTEVAPNDDDDASEPPTADPFPDVVPVDVTVLLDGQPAPDVTVLQGGFPERWTTGPEGQVTVDIDRRIDAQLWILASHPQARIWGTQIELDAPQEAVTIELDSLNEQDNLDYLFKDPGTPERNDTTAMCAHCHVTMVDDWFGSAHRDAARDPQVQDLYAGAAQALDEQACIAASGTWTTGRAPGTQESAARCYVGEGVLPALNGCDEGPCEQDPTAFGGCADCHAPGMDGALGGRDLHDALGHSFEYGVHCDVCHRVESVDLEAEAGTAGRLAMKRPFGPGAFAFPERPLTFGPYDDVMLGVMGAVQRDVYTEGVFCAGCHQLDQEVLVPSAEIDTDRWPSGRLPIHSTYAEWLDISQGVGLPCQDCHMPPAGEEVLNAADLQLLSQRPGMVTGWVRDEGTVHRHSFEGPVGENELLRNAVFMNVQDSLEEGVLTATVSVTNTSFGHALPTGEPMRAMLLHVSARCADDELVGSGPALSDVAGVLAIKESGEDWTLWPGAQIGQVVRVISRPGGYWDDVGFGPFGEAGFAPADKGLPIEEIVGQATITAMNGDVATFDGVLPAGDRALLGEAPSTALDAREVRALAGAAGHAFAKVLTGPDGSRQVPHFLAVDVAADNRLLPQRQWSGTWTFAAPCAEPTVRASLLYRAWPLALARERGWDGSDVVMVEAE